MKLYLFIGEKIRKHRKNNGLTKEELANEIGLSRASIVQIEQGKQRISIHHLCEMAKIFDQPITAFLLIEKKLTYNGWYNRQGGKSKWI